MHECAKAAARCRRALADGGVLLARLPSFVGHRRALAQPMACERRIPRFHRKPREKMNGVSNSVGGLCAISYKGDTAICNGRWPCRFEAVGRGTDDVCS